MSSKRIGIAVAGIAAAGALGIGGATLANAATGDSPSIGATGSGYAAGQKAGQGNGGSSDTPVTGDELTKVTNAVKAKDSSVTVTGVQKDPDGSYDVFATKAGAQVMFEVSADLNTITQNAQGPGVMRQNGNRAPASTAPSNT